MKYLLLILLTACAANTETTPTFKPLALQKSSLRFKCNDNLGAVKFSFKLQQGDCGDIPDYSYDVYESSQHYSEQAIGIFDPNACATYIHLDYELHEYPVHEILELTWVLNPMTDTVASGAYFIQGHIEDDACNAKYEVTVTKE